MYHDAGGHRERPLLIRAFFLGLLFSAVLQVLLCQVQKTIVLTGLFILTVITQFKAQSHPLTPYF